jgi:hypothetical protein
MIFKDIYPVLSLARFKVILVPENSKSSVTAKTAETAETVFAGVREDMILGTYLKLEDCKVRDIFEGTDNGIPAVVIAIQETDKEKRA